MIQHQTEKWFAEVQVYASSLLGPTIQRRLKKSQPDCWSDDFSWLPNPAVHEIFVELFAQHYTHVRCFHGGRPRDVRSYMEQGLRGQSPDDIENTFLEMFSDAPASTLDSALNEFQGRKQRERGKLWVLLEKSELIEQSGHYLIQGSEYLMALAATLWRIHPVEDYRLRLRKVGVPTILEVHVPITYFSDQEIEALAGLVLARWGQRVSSKNLGMSHVPCLVVRRDIEPKHIVDHWHPQHIPDPHFGYRLYSNPHTVCDFCQQ